MNARAIAEDVVTWYQDKLDPWANHTGNVRRHLFGPVLCLSHGILTGKDQACGSSNNSVENAEEEKKSSSGYDVGYCLDGSEQGADESGILDRTMWSMAADSKGLDDLYHSLGRRDRARLDAFFTNVELAAPSEEGNTATASTSSSDSAESDYKTPTKKRSGSITASPVLSSINSTLKRSFSNSDLNRLQPQIRQQELRIRLELYLRSLYRVRSLERACVIAVEPERAIRGRTEMIVSAFVATVGSVRGAGPFIYKLLVNLTKELLAVEYVAEDIYRVIRRIVNDYEHGNSFASLAFLSSPDASAENRLVPMVLKFIRFLQLDWKTHETACELERMLAESLDGNMRRYLKTVEFQSIGHLLEICQGFRNELANIQLMPSNAGNGMGDLCNSPEAVRQAIRDLQREVITINGHALPPVTSRRDLVNLLSQSLNSSTLTAKNNRDQHNDDMGFISTSQSCPSLISTEISTAPSSDVDSSLDSPGQRRKSRKASFHMGTVDLLTRRLLIAASRTGTGGDAYFIVRDLFGDPDVEVVPSQVLPHHVRATRVGSIEIQVRLASVTIKCHGSFDIYPKSLVGSCEPLIQLHTTSSETIYLQELRPCDSSSEDGKNCFADDGSRSSDGMEALVLQEKRTKNTGRRILSIRPALYEKVQVWNTPS